MCLSELIDSTLSFLLRIIHVINVTIKAKSFAKHETNIWEYNSHKYNDFTIRIIFGIFIAMNQEVKA